MATDGKVAVPAGKAPKVARQPLVGKLGGDMGSMPGSKGKGGAVTTKPSNPITGNNKPFGSGSGIIDGKV